MPADDLLLIPVIDLLHGQVVRGVQGRRETYLPIVSALCNSSDPLVVARILCDHCNAATLYVADLDALMGGAPQSALLRALLAALPNVSLWVDAGFADAGAAARLLAAIDAPETTGPLAQRVVPIFASEALRSRADLAQCFAGDKAAGVLSLDRRDGKKLDSAGCWDAPDLWPQRVIVMTLERVGAGTGPDLDTVAALRSRAPAATLIGAGGLRSPADMASAAAAGADAWLVASALHDGQLARVRR